MKESKHAYPLPGVYRGNGYTPSEPGMSTRLYIATEVLKALLVGDVFIARIQSQSESPDEAVRLASKAALGHALILMEEDAKL